MAKQSAKLRAGLIAEPSEYYDPRRVKNLPALRLGNAFVSLKSQDVAFVRSMQQVSNFCVRVVCLNMVL